MKLIALFLCAAALQAQTVAINVHRRSVASAGISVLTPQSTDRASNSTGSTISSLSTAGTSHTAGNALVFYTRNSAGGPPTSVTNTAGDTFHTCTGASDAIGAGTIWWATNIAGNASDVVTVNLSGSSAYVALIGIEVSGLNASPQDLCNTNAFAGTATITTGSFTTTSTNELLLMGALWGALGYTNTPGSGYTVITDAAGMCAFQYKVVTSIQTGVTASMVVSSVTNGNWSFVSLKQ